VAGRRTAFSSPAANGRLLVLGDYDQGRADFAWNDVLHRELHIIGSNASGSEDWRQGVRLALAGELPLQRLVTHRFPAERFQDAFALARSRSGEVVKVVVIGDPQPLRKIPGGLY